MKYLLALVLVLFSLPSWAVTLTQDNCSWNNPGVNPYKGTPSNAIDYYLDIPKESREILKSRIAAYEPDEIVDITKHGIFGNHGYGSDIEEMHFSTNSVCTNISRDRWPENMIQKGAVYCEGKHCILVPYICGNFSRIRKIEDVRVLPKIPMPEQLPFQKTDPTPIPEPGSIALILGGLASLFLIRKKK